jgi:hypothetical protein
MIATYLEVLVQIMNMQYLSKIRNWISSFNPLNTNFFATMMWQNLPFFYNYIDDGIHMDSVLFFAATFYEYILGL